MMFLQNLYELGLAVRQERREAGLTQLELSKRALVSRRWLIDLETGNLNAPDARKIFSVLRALDLRFGLESRTQVPQRPLNQATRDALRLMDQMD
ncbi:helix-turn-helix domain-containing protein [Nesterenkonia sp. Act20]|uniref:helix-turn-helix domain-containing protein n=1 Tax=Nesterenkonia sp. Act20 TaxID=1483432 RepID=UPI001C449DF8|nr:helix-turn-helix domain-containing protein [Nesterenkonia sp. Act20]